MIAGPAWSRVLLLLMGAGVLAYLFLPMQDNARTGLYNVVAVSALLLAWYGIAHHRPARRSAWQLLAAGFSMWVVGDALSSLEFHLWAGEVYPVPSDAVYLSGYGLLTAGALLMVRTRRAGQDFTALLDGAIVATGTGVVAGVFVIAPLAASSDLTTLGKVVSSAYPLGDVLLLVVVIRMWATQGGRSLSYRLVVAGLALTLVGDVLWHAAVLVTGSPVSPVSDASWLTSYIVLAAATCEPSMRGAVEPGPDRKVTGSSRRRLVVLAGGVMLPAVALLVDGATGGDVLWLLIGVGSLLMTVLVLVRMGGILSTVEGQAVQLAALARDDALTGAPNRRTWDHELSRACAASREQGTQLCVAMLDIDHFKAYNDTFGHPAGDLVLREAVAAWTQQLGDEALLARYGGEEFAVLIRGLSPADAVTLVTGLRAVTPQGQTFSAGVAAWDPATEPATVVAHADLALYEAKHSGRDRVVGHDEARAGTGPSGDPTRTQEPVSDPVQAVGSG